MVENRLNPDERPRYETPTAVRLDDMHAGQGECTLPGSGDFSYCDPGNVPLGDGCLGGSTDQPY